MTKIGDAQLWAVEIENVRTYLRLSKQYFADRVGCGLSQLNSWLSGAECPSVHQLLVIARLAGRNNTHIRAKIYQAFEREHVQSRERLATAQSVTRHLDANGCNAILINLSLEGKRDLVAHHLSRAMAELEKGGL